MSQTPSPDPALLNELVRRIVEAVQPLRIILFGSAARGEMGPNSDLDVLVVVPDSADLGDSENRVWRSERPRGLAIDFVVASESTLQRYVHSPYLVYHWAVKDGREPVGRPPSEARATHQSDQKLKRAGGPSVRGRSR